MPEAAQVAGGLSCSEHNRLVMLAQYDAANNRRAANFGFFWQSVSLSLAAQAFLFVVSLDPSTRTAGRFIASGISVIVSFAALSLMATQQRFQKIEASWLDYIEEKLIDGCKDAEPHPLRMNHDAKVRERLRELRERTGQTASWWDRAWRLCGDATRWWRGLLCAFLAADVTIMVLTGFFPGVLSG